MPRFYFESYDNGSLTPDDVGLELATIESARQEAIKGLADLSADVAYDERHELAVVVLNQARIPLFKAILVFELIDLAPAIQATNPPSE
jgi:hypothetical protein